MIQLPPNSTGSVLASLNDAGKEYQQVILCDSASPGTLQARIDSDGNLKVSDKTNKHTYTSCSGDRNPGTSLTSIIADLKNPAAKRISLLKVKIEFTEATTAAAYIVKLVKTSTLEGGDGTSAAENILQHDDDSPAPTAVSAFYTAAPTAGAALGTLGSAYLFGQVTGAIDSPIIPIIFDFSQLNQKPSLSLNTQSFDVRIETADGSVLATPANIGVWHIDWTWSEE